MQESKEWNEAAEVLATVRNSLGTNGEGGTDSDNHNCACVLNREWRPSSSCSVKYLVSSFKKARCISLFSTAEASVRYS